MKSNLRSEGCIPFTTAEQVIQALQEIGSAETAVHSAKFFKSGSGEYGEGDRFLGVRVPEQRKLAKRATAMPLAQVLKLLRSPFHEARLTAALILAQNYARADQAGKQKIFDAYLKSTRYLNNWDIVDSSAHKIVGPHLAGGDHALLYQLAQSKSLWERRIAVIATLHGIRNDRFDIIYRLCEMLLGDSEDLIHKASGWMLREAGKKQPSVLRKFLDAHAARMPRTMLRYAIEKLPEELRKYYLSVDLKL